MFNISPPEYIIEKHIDGDWCIIFDPVSGGEYSSFQIDYLKPTWVTNSEIREHLESARNFMERTFGVEVGDGNFETT